LIIKGIDPESILNQVQDRAQNDPAVAKAMAGTAKIKER
jgi:hypothetical protein